MAEFQEVKERMKFMWAQGHYAEVAKVLWPAAEAIVEAAADRGGFYRSNDNGVSWQRMSNHRTSGLYYQEIFADPHDVDRVYSMDVRDMVTDDGGRYRASALQPGDLVVHGGPEAAALTREADPREGVEHVALVWPDKAVTAAIGTAAACSKVTLAGFNARASSRAQTYSAKLPNASKGSSPNTSSPT